jgi:DNA-directed RNA polymerase subunit omega
MNPSIVFDCQKILPNRFALTLAAAARSRALNRGAEPRFGRSGSSVADLALSEIASGAFTSDELALFLPRSYGAIDRSAARPLPEVCTT